MITLRLDLNNLKERVACQRAIMDRVLDDLRDVNGELKTLVGGLPSVDFFLFQPVQNYALSRWDVYGKCSLCDLCDSD